MANRSHVGAKIFTLPRLTLVLGGAASGKSRFAEDLVRRAPGPHRYVATAQAFDEEMRAKILKHQQDRGEGWDTTEAPYDLAGALTALPGTAPVLVDCLTLWLSNIILAQDTEVTKNQPLRLEFDQLLNALADAKAPIVTVSNEVGQGIVPENRLGRAFRNHQGRLNQAVAAQADLVVLVAAGLPLVLKGQMP